MKCISQVCIFLVTTTAVIAFSVSTNSQSPNSTPPKIVQVKPSKVTTTKSSQESLKAPGEALKNISETNATDNRIKFATLCVLVISAGAGLCQYHINNQWNRRKNTHDFLITYILGPVTKIRCSLEKKINPFDSQQCYEDMKDALSDEDCAGLRDLLNYLEHMSTAIKHDIINEKIAFDCAQAILTDYYRWSAKFIQSKREEAKAPGAWEETENLAEKWREWRNDKDKARLEKEANARSKELGQVTINNNPNN